MHASDQAHLLRAARGSVVSGSVEEADALRMIDAARADELAQLSDTPERRAKRARKAWSHRGKQLGGSW